MARILIIDDEPAVAQVIAELVALDQHEALYPRDWRDLAGEALAQRYDLVITDVVMPNISGWDLIAEIRRHKPEVGIIAMSGGGMIMPADAALQRSRAVGADAVIEKPIEAEVLLRQVSAVLARRG